MQDTSESCSTRLIYLFNLPSQESVHAPAHGQRLRDDSKFTISIMSDNMQLDTIPAPVARMLIDQHSAELQRQFHAGGNATSPRA